ncbi:MAG: aminopeptidase [Deltaproteobacteria bacterium]|nr:aminopeptidase [Deltaproteobacteria bacterium]
MKEPRIDPDKLDLWARLLVTHSIGGVTREDRVMIKGERIAWPLMERIERDVIAAGAVPDVYIVPPNNERGKVWSAAMGRGAGEEQLARVPDWHHERYASMTKYIEVLGAESPASYAGLAREASAALARADRPFADLRLARRWVITLYPTPAYAEMEGIPLEDYVRFVVDASTIDPRPLLEAEERLSPLFQDGKRMEVVTWLPGEGRELVLTMDLSHSIPVLSHGLRNVPDGEVFTSPDASSVEGEIYLDLPVLNGGVDISGIHLVFESGRIVKYSAREGETQLASIVETDHGSRRLGEVALGMNPGLTRALKHPLFVEKVGGTLHVAIGASYEASFERDPKTPAARARLEELAARGVLNRSAQHVDIVCDFREGGCGQRVSIDGHPIVVKGGLWVPG